VRLLFDYDAEPNMQPCGEEGNPLKAAVIRKLEFIIQLLRDKGANINAVGGKCGTVLQAAAGSGHLEHIKALLEHGAHINLPGGQYGFALQAAACSRRCDPGDLDIIQYLLDKGANVDAVGGGYGTALQAAVYHHKPYVEMLRKHWASLRIEGGKY
jgi:ankyrin repeat protein